MKHLIPILIVLLCLGFSSQAFSQSDFPFGPAKRLVFDVDPFDKDPNTPENYSGTDVSVAEYQGKLIIYWSHIDWTANGATTLYYGVCPDTDPRICEPGGTPGMWTNKKEVHFSNSPDDDLGAGMHGTEPSISSDNTKLFFHRARNHDSDPVICDPTGTLFDKLTGCINWAKLVHWDPDLNKPTFEWQGVVGGTINTRGPSTTFGYSKVQGPSISDISNNQATIYYALWDPNIRASIAKANLVWTGNPATLTSSGSEIICQGTQNDGCGNPGIYPGADPDKLLYKNSHMSPPPIKLTIRGVEKDLSGDFDFSTGFVEVNNLNPSENMNEGPHVIFDPRDSNEHIAFFSTDEGFYISYTNYDEDDAQDNEDNCPFIPNSDQANDDLDPAGTACDCNENTGNDPTNFSGCSYSDCDGCTCSDADTGKCRKLCAKCARCMYPGGEDNPGDGWDSNCTCDPPGGVTDPGSECDDDHNYCGTVIIRGTQTNTHLPMNMALYLLPALMILLVRRMTRTT